MRRIASHYIYWKQFYRMHYVELDDRGALTNVFPLEGEIAGTEFYDGILIPIPVPALEAGSQRNCLNRKSDDIACSPAIPRQAREQVAFDLLPGETLADALKRKGFTDACEAGLPVCLLLLNGVSFAAAKFGTDNSRCNGYIQRL